MTELAKFIGQIAAALAICWVVIRLVLDRYFKVSDELEKEKKHALDDNIKRIEGSNSEVKTAVFNLKEEIRKLENRVLKSQLRGEAVDDKLKEIAQSLEKLSDETKESISSMEKSIIISLGNDLLMIKSIAQKLRGDK